MRSRSPRTYLPHRAIITIAVTLITVAVAGGLLGVVEANRAEQAANVMTNRYLVLQPVTRQLRASVSSFQVVAEQEFAGTSDGTTLLAQAVDASTAADKAYAALVPLLANGSNVSLAPGLAALEAAYVRSRTGLATFLSVVAKSPQAVIAATSERTADANLDAALALLQAATSARLTQAAGQTRSAARDARDDLIICLVIGVAFGVTLTTLFARKAMRVERDLSRRDAVQVRLTRRNEFEGRLQRAMEMAKAEAAVFDLVTEALTEAASGMPSELLLADSSRAHFRQVLVSADATAGFGCGVISPEDCPAASRGQTLVFPVSAAMDACPQLRGLGCSALCVPVSISGNSVGVVHVTGAEGSPPGDEVTRDIEVVVRRASERLAMLRAFEMSQTEANSDSLTGLVTRRSLEARTRDLRATGDPYAVAYGDLDHFKQLNDVFGHAAGDRALRTFAQVLRDALRPSDVACRYGGEEFVILLPACPITEAAQVLDRIRTRLASRLASSGLPAFTASFGVASSDQAADFTQVVALADEALLLAKAAGRDQVVVAADRQLGGPPGQDDTGPPRPEISVRADGPIGATTLTGPARVDVWTAASQGTATLVGEVGI